MVKKKKLHFTTLNYTLYYTLHSKLFKCTFNTLNYDHYYTLKPSIEVAFNLDGNSKFMVQIVIKNIVYRDKV